MVNQYLIGKISYQSLNANLLKLLHDHGASYSEWKEDCTRYNDPLEVLAWLGY